MLEFVLTGSVLFCLDNWKKFCLDKFVMLTVIRYEGQNGTSNRELDEQAVITRFRVSKKP
jgi:hypothetical protein